MLTPENPSPSEEWRPIPSHPTYEASSLGRVRSLRHREPLLLRGSINGAGYRQVTLRHDGDRKYATVHALVAEAFHGPRPEGMEVRHLDGSRTNNQPANLRWGTASENRYDSVRHGTHPMVARRNRQERAA